MTLTQQIIINILTSSSISALVVFGLRTYLSEKIKASIKSDYDKKLEDFKSKIKQSEYIRNNRYAALKELYVLYDQICPEKTHPDMDWEDALSDITCGFESHSKQLKKFVRDYGFILDKDISELISDSISYAQNGKFEEDYHQYDYAKKLYESVKEAKEKLFNQLNKDFN